MIEQLIEQLNEAGVKLARNGAELSIDAPFGALDNETIEQLSQKKEQIVQFLANTAVHTLLTPKQRIILERARQDERINLSYNQTRLLTLSGGLKVANLQAALNQLVQRHEALRAAPTADGLHQQILPLTTAPLQLIDLSQLATPERKAQLDVLQNEEIETPFELDSKPLFRAKLIKLGAESYQLMLTTHALIADGWSMRLLIQNLAALYTAVCTHTRPKLNPAMPLHRYVEHQTRLQEKNRFQEDKTYWTNKFPQSVPTVKLPTDQPRSPHIGVETVEQTSQLPKKLLQTVKKAAAAQNCTLAVYLMAAYQLMLYRFSGQSEVVVGVPLIGQTTFGTVDLVSNCEIVLPIQQKFDPNTSFKWVLTQTAKALADSVAHPNFSAEQLPQQSKTAPLSPISVLFNHLGAEQAGDFWQLTAVSQPLPHATQPYELTFTVIEQKDGVLLRCRANRDLYKPATIQRQLDAFITILQESAHDPYQKIGRLPLLSDAEQERLIHRWNYTAEVYDTVATIGSLFEAQVAKTPNKIALRYKEKTFTYRELNAKANQIAHLLQSYGVQPSQFVGLCLDRKPAMLIGLLAILKTGAAVLPLAVGDGGDGTTGRLAQVNAPILLTQSSLQTNFSEFEGKLLLIDGDWQAINAQTTMNVKTAVSSQDPATVLFVNGRSTQTVAVPVTHQNLVNLLTTLQQKPGITPDDLLLAATPIGQDTALIELLLPLVSGATLLLASAQQQASSDLLADAFRRNGVTMMHAAPSRWQALLDSGWQPSATLIMLTSSDLQTGNEQLTRSLVQALRQTGDELWHMSGLAETAVWAATWRVQPDSPILLGKPLGNTQLYILDEYGEPVPVGVQGDLWLGGDGLVDGYLNQPEPTEHHFVPNPFIAGQKIFRSGIKARFLSDGNIERLGVDNL